MERALTGRVARIDHAEYVDALPALKHIFLVGNLLRPTPHPFIRDERVEVIVVGYEAGDDGVHHWHPDATEYEIVIDGEIGYFEVATGATHWFSAGDMVAIPAGACVKRLVRRPARAVTLKVPSGSRKIGCSACVRECAWRVDAFAG
jgi:hypothetical protein